MANMIRILILFLLGYFLNGFSQYDSQIKVLTYNLFAGGHTNSPYDDIVEVLNDIDTDISGHQEVDSCNGRNSLDVIRWLGEEIDYSSHFTPALKNWNGGQYGNGMLSRYEPDNIRKFWIELGSMGAEDRSASEIEITMNNELVRVLNTHVAYAGVQAPAKQAEEMVKWIDEGGSRDTPMIIMGDFNSTPGDAAMTHFEEAGFKYVRNDNGNVMDNIDHIMYRPADSWKVIGKGKPTKYNASDHDPVWAILQLKTDNTSKNISSLKQINYLSVKSLSKKALIINSPKADIYNVKIYKSNGQLIKIFASLNLKSGSNQISIKRLDISHGMYIIKLESNLLELSHKLFIEN